MWKEGNGGLAIRYNEVCESMKTKKLSPPINNVINNSRPACPSGSGFTLQVHLRSGSYICLQLAGYWVTVLSKSRLQFPFRSSALSAWRPGVGVLLSLSYLVFGNKIKITHRISSFRALGETNETQICAVEESMLTYGAAKTMANTDARTKTTFWRCIVRSVVDSFFLWGVWSGTWVLTPTWCPAF